MATSSIAAKPFMEIERNLLTCALCHKPYNNPKALPCLHSFCRGCLDGYISTTSSSSGSGGSCIFCPTCRQVTDVPADGIAGFHDNGLLHQLLEALRQHTVPPCDVCRDADGSHHNATWCCMSCEEFLCSDCAGTHKRTRLTREHLVINVNMIGDMCGRRDANICVRLLNKIGCYSDQLHNPIAITINMADDIVVSNNNDTVSVFSQTGECKWLLEQRPFYGDEKNFLPNRGVAVTAEGFLAVAMRRDFATLSVQVGIVQSLAGRQAGVFSVKTRHGSDCIPHGIVVTSDNNTIITDVGRHCFYVFNADMHMVHKVGKRGSKNTQFKSPFFINVNGKKEILISDYDNHCVKVFDMHGKFRRRFGEIGRNIGQLMHPMGLCTDAENNVFICDRDNHRVQMFDSAGKFLTVICQNTCRDGNDIRPQDVAMTTNGHLAVLVKGVEGVNIAEIHILQVGMSRFSSGVQKEAAETELRQITSKKVSRPMQSTNVLPPIGQRTVPSAPPDLVTLTHEQKRHTANGMACDGLPSLPSTVCVIM